MGEDKPKRCMSDETTSPPLKAGVVILPSVAAEIFSGLAGADLKNGCNIVSGASGKARRVAGVAGTALRVETPALPLHSVKIAEKLWMGSLGLILSSSGWCSSLISTCAKGQSPQLRVLTNAIDTRLIYACGMGVGLDVIMC